MANTYYTIYLHTVFAVKPFLDEYDRLLRLNRVVNPQHKFMRLI